MNITATNKVRRYQPLRHRGDVSTPMLMIGISLLNGYQAKSTEFSYSIWTGGIKLDNPIMSRSWKTCYKPANSYRKVAYVNVQDLFMADSAEKWCAKCVAEYASAFARDVSGCFCTKPLGAHCP
uniref:Uncharacterized protein n=1 Tax=Chlamydomonas leiostraca TaxID=1034604 RepID=A0A7S0WJG7_9CHLO